MRYFQYLSNEEQQSIFHLPPTVFSKESDKATLSYALGAVLYMPATRNQILDDIISNKHKGLVSMVLCLEDAIGDNQVELAEKSLVAQINKLALLIKNGRIHADEVPLIFVRVREPQQINRITDYLGENIAYLTGFVFPKFSRENGEQYFEILQNTNKSLQTNLYGMPILEHPSIIYKESRLSCLLELKEILDKHSDLVLNVRIGATDFSSLFGLRRSMATTIYDITVIRDCIADIVNIFNRNDSGFVVSGPVYEYFQSPTSWGNKAARPQLVSRSLYEEGLIKEVLLDKENGLIGKTIIHPSQIQSVQSLYVVSHEEYLDACSIICKNKAEIGVTSSAYANKMNEIKPHLSWAQKILTRANVYGVYHEQNNYTNLLVEKVHV